MLPKIRLTGKDFHKIRRDLRGCRLNSVGISSPPQRQKPQIKLGKRLLISFCWKRLNVWQFIVSNLKTSRSADKKNVFVWTNETESDFGYLNTDDSTQTPRISAEFPQRFDYNSVIVGFADSIAWIISFTFWSVVKRFLRLFFKQN